MWRTWAAISTWPTSWLAHQSHNTRANLPPGIIFNPIYEDLKQGRLGEDEMVDICVSDPRLANFGVNLITFRSNEFERQMRLGASETNTSFCSEKEYHMYRLLRYVFEVA